VFPLRRSRPEVAQVVRELPDGYHAVELGTDHVVVGPTGAFALTTADGPDDIDEAARRVVRIAGDVRDLLADDLSWAPFVDPLVVVEEATDRPAVAATVPHRLLHGVLTGGQSLLDVDQVGRIVASLRGRAVLA
jgi:hypothetical protein